MTRETYLISLKEPNSEVRAIIDELWSPDNRFHWTDTDSVISHQPGGTSVYDLIENRLKKDRGESYEAFRAIVFSLKNYHGYGPKWLWDRLEAFVE